MADWILIAVLIVVFVVAAWYTFKKKKSGCGGCGGCPHARACSKSACDCENKKK